MALTNDLMNGRFLLWKTEVPPEQDIVRVSPGFTFQGSEWHFEFCLDEDDDCEVHLRKKSEWGGFRPFHVYCYAESEEEGIKNCCIRFKHTNISPEESNSFVWYNVQFSRPDNKDEFYLRGKIAFVFIFGCDKECSYMNGGSKRGEALTEINLDLDSRIFELESFSQDFNSLLDNEELSDVQLKCDDCVIPAHRSVLAARSEVFSAMFRNKMKESSSGIVDITDVEAPVLKSFLKYVYSGNASDLSEDMVTKLYTVGDKYAVNSLKKKCSEFMIKNLSGENYLNFLMMADTHNDKDFKNAIIGFVQNQPEFLKLDSWYKFSEEHSNLANEVYRKIFDDLDL